VSFALDAQIVSQPEVFADVLARTPPVPLDPERTLIFSGIGTSLHAARVAVSWVTKLTGGAVRAVAIDAHDLALREPLVGDEQVIVISHRGYKRYPTAALHKAREHGAATVAIVGRDAPEQSADQVIRTCANELAGTFSVSYLASLAALGAIVSPFDTTGRFAAALAEVPDALEETIERPPPVAIAERIVEREPLLLVGFGVDHVTVDEASLKIKEGAWLWAEGMSTEFSMHGTPAVYRPGQAAIVVIPGEDDGGRTEALLEMLAKIGLEVVTCGSGPEAQLSFVSTPVPLRPIVGIVAFQRLTAELARLRGADPDTLHGNRDAWREAMTAVKL
jgi:glucosamine--fructose-6-phosphate aminotransferase (isomerizing)